LDWATAMIETRPDPEIEQADFAFSTMFVDPDDEDVERLDGNVIRDVFFEFM
jgi:hypothetical protein